MQKLFDLVQRQDEAGAFSRRGELEAVLTDVESRHLLLLNGVSHARLSLVHLRCRRQYEWEHATSAVVGRVAVNAM
jgi:hypothetical protein